jgi:tRNA A-37 threonylcarbamoyl transferase component Bud32
MDEKRVCPSCQKALPPGAPLGLCPECLIKSGFLTGTKPATDSSGGAPVAPPPIEEIARLFPQLEILGLLGKGGMGAVYKARQRQLDRLVALKILPREAGRDPSFAERFAREAKALARLNHPNIVSVYDFGQQDGLYFLLMEYVDGVNLRQLERSRRLSPGEALAIVPSICEALQYAHQQGIVHRDIKPENILLDKQGRVKIADFGIAKLLGADRQAEALTGAQQTIGTPHYMAPEQVEKPAAVDHRADIYSLGVVFYEMLTGELPLGKFAPPSQKVHLDVRLDEIVLRALEKEPERRYQHADEVKTEVETVLAAPARDKQGPSELKKFKRFALGLWVSALVLVPLLCFLAFAAWSKLQGRSAGPGPQPATEVRQGQGDQGPAPAQATEASPERIRATSVEEWFDRLDKDGELGDPPFTALNALEAKAKESAEVQDQIIRLASATIDDPKQNMFKRWQCCYVLSGIGDKRGIPTVARALKDQSDIVRSVAACALGAFDDAEAKSALEVAAKTETSPRVLESIQKALKGEYRKQVSERKSP